MCTHTRIDGQMNIVVILRQSPCSPEACGNHYGEKEEIKSFHNEIIYDLRCKDTESFRYTQKNRRKFTFGAIFLCLDFVGLPKKLYSLTTKQKGFTRSSIQLQSRQQLG